MHTVDAAEEQSSPNYCTHLYLQKTHECNLHLQKTQKAELFNSKRYHITTLIRQLYSRHKPKQKHKPWVKHQVEAQIAGIYIQAIYNIV